MEVDLYAFCPCGSGKKIKFCKCHETIGDLDKISKMVEGGQMVAALDRANQVLAEHPDAAWALAVKGRLLLRLRENDKLGENAERFLRLQPSNPLALLQRAAAQLGRGEVDPAVQSILASMSESRDTHDSFLFEIAAALGLVLAENGNLLSARAYLALAAMPDVPVSEMASNVLSEVSQNASINLLLKHLPDTFTPQAGSAWLERFEEAMRLLEVNSVILAESKFQALDRQFGGQPAIVAGLLRCAIWRADQAEQAKLLGKLADISTLPEEDRDRYRAMSILVEPGQPKLALASRDLVWDVGDLDVVHAALTADTHTISLPAEMAREMIFEEGGVPPRGAYQLLDRPRPEGEGFPAAEATPEVIGMLLVYGRQTDRPARLLAINVLNQHETQVSRIISQAMQGQESTASVLDDHPAPLFTALTGSVPSLRIRNITPADVTKWQRELLSARLLPRLLESRIPLFEGKSVGEAAEDASLRSRVVALVRILEGYDSLVSDVPAALSQVRNALHVSELPEVDPAGRQAVRVPVYQLARLRTDSLGADDTMVLMERARTSACKVAVKRFAEHLLGLALGKDLQHLKVAAYLALAESADDVKSGLERIEAGKQWAKLNQVSTASLLLSEIGFRLQAGDAPGLQRCIQSITSEHGTNHNVMAQLQQLLVMYGLLNPDGSPRRSGGPPPSAGGPSVAPAQAAPQGAGKLWTPDSAAPAANQGGSKLWVPGMD